MGIFDPKNKKTTRAAVQTAPQPRPEHWQPQRFLPAEAPLYRALRQSIPIIDAALQKIVRLTVDFTLTAAEPKAQPLLSRFAAEVPVGASGRGLAAFAGQYLDSLLCYGSAVGEVVLDHDREKLLGLYLPPLSHLSFQQGSSPLEAVICAGEGRDRRPLPCPELILFTALHPAPGEITGQSLLSGLPAISRVLLQIYSAIGKNFERMGNLRYAVTYRPTPGDGTDAAAVANEISREWSTAMQAAAEGEIRDFVAVGDVDIRVIGADNQFIATEVPVRQLLEQIVAGAAALPAGPELEQHRADEQPAERSAYRRAGILPAAAYPVLAQSRAVPAQSGLCPEVAVEWAPISLQDETEEATARLTRAKAEELERKLAHEAKQEGTA
ncbi:MAG: serine/threonine protein phosphatase [Angelakisella sp.]